LTFGVGNCNPMWKGDDAGYEALHGYIKRRLPKPELCDQCHESEPYDLANVSGEYKRDLPDWEWLCRKCHMIKDGRLEIVRQRALLHNATFPMEQFRRKSSIGESNPNHKLTNADVILIRKLLQDGIRGSVLARRYNVTGVCISGIKTGKSWSKLLTEIGIKEQ